MKKYQIILKIFINDDNIDGGLVKLSASSRQDASKKVYDYVSRNYPIREGYQIEFLDDYPVITLK